MTSTVTAALAGAAAGGAPSGTSFNMPKMIGMTVTGISMITVPATVGVKIRRIQESRAESRNWHREEAMTRVASSAGPPCASAVTQTAMKAPEVPMRRTYPAPMRPTRTACNTVVSPLTASAAKTVQDRNRRSASSFSIRETCASCADTRTRRTPRSPAG